MTAKLLKLFAKDAEDTQVISAILQDSIAPVCDIAYLPEEKEFVMVVQRYRREATAEPCAERTRCAVHVKGVAGAQWQRIDLNRKEDMLDLLAVIPEKGSLQFVFAGGGKIRLALDTTKWSVILEDFGEPWPSACHPRHEQESA